MRLPLQTKRQVRRASRLFHPIAVGSLLCVCILTTSCGDVYRPVAQVIPQPSPNPGAFHFVVSLSMNGLDVFDPTTNLCQPSGTPAPCVADSGAASRLDVSGDTNVGILKTGVVPVHAVLLPNASRLYVVNSAEGTVTENVASTPTVPTTISLPAGSKPVFVHTAENNNVYTANFGNNTVSVINTTLNVVTATVAVGTHPVALAETPNGQKLYVANQSSGTVTVISTIDDTVIATIPVGSSPVWTVARPDSARIYVLDSNGTIYDIDTLSDTALPMTGSSGGTGANFMLYDSTSNSLLVTNSGSRSLGILSASTDPPTLHQGVAITIPAPAIANYPCQSAPVVPSAVTMLPDGRAYVASYQVSSGLVCTQSSVIDTAAGAVTKTIPLSASADLSPQTGCGSAGFRVFTTSSGGGSTSNFKVYVSQCDAGSIAVVDTFAANSHPPDSLNATLPAPAGSFAPQRVSITGASEDAAHTATTFAYTPVSGSGLQMGMTIFITGMADSTNNGIFLISSLGSGTFTVANASGVTSASQNGSGIVVPPQNPVFLVAGP